VFLRERAVARKRRAEGKLMGTSLLATIGNPPYLSPWPRKNARLMADKLRCNAALTGWGEVVRLWSSWELRAEWERSGARTDYRMMHGGGALQAVPCAVINMAFENARRLLGTVADGRPEGDKHCKVSEAIYVS
jgi:hypothetical protein